MPIITSCTQTQDVKAEFQMVVFLNRANYTRNWNKIHCVFLKLKPFPGMHSKGSLKRVYNYRLCRARRVVENVFGISSAVFPVFRKPLLLEPEKAKLIVMTVVHLHNFLRSCNSMNMYTPPGTFDTEVDGHIIEGSWRRTASDEETTSLLPLSNVPRKSCKSAQEIREELSQYFQTENRLEWQDEYA